MAFEAALSAASGFKIWLYGDQARWHRGEDVDLFLHTRGRWRLEYLPCHRPGLNLQERIWSQIRVEATTNRWLETLDDIRLKV